MIYTFLVYDYIYIVKCYPQSPKIMKVSDFSGWKVMELTIEYQDCQKSPYL